MKYSHQAEKYYVQIFSSNDEIKKKSSRFASIVIYARNKYGLIGVIIANLLLSLISILLITVLQVYLHNLISSVCSLLICFFTFDTYKVQYTDNFIKLMYLVIAFLGSFNWIIVFLFMLFYENLLLFF
ncbi:MAG: hypothetical protein GX490_05860 [Bacilli bacterium]|nr:hypothetical protein [Bacilli bacterium]